MSVSGVCQVCESAEGEFTCDLCGQYVCTDHYEPGSGVCTMCAGSDGEGPGRGDDRPGGTQI